MEQVDACCWRIPKSYRPDMRVDGLIFANDRLMKDLRHDQAAEQVANVATLPGIQGASLAMPDIHWGYGFCIGGVAATDPAEGGVISPGGIGFDINCGVRLIRSNLKAKRAGKHIRELVKVLFENVPAGVGRSGKYKFSDKELRPLMEQGAGYVVGREMGTPRDLEHMESNGRIADADPDMVTRTAIERGAKQCGTLGSGNHFLEIQVVDEIHDEATAKAFGLEKDMVCVMIHSGSRGLGYKVCSDAILDFRDAPRKYGIELPDKQLICAPANSPEGKRYIGAMRAAANYGFCNRQLLMAQARDCFAAVFGESWEDLGMELLYDVAHNIAKLEDHVLDGVKRRLWVHRKGATRAFPAGHPELPEAYRLTGQPVIIPGDMGRASWVLVGAAGSMERSFGTTCHGAGRAMSRTAAIKDVGSRKRRQGVGGAGRDRHGRLAQGLSRGAAEGVQERRSRRRGRPRGEPVAQGRTDAADRGD